MRTEKVIVCDPEGKIVISTVDVVKAVCVTVRGLIGAVEAFNHLFERTMFCRNGIVVGKPNHLGDFEGKIFPQLFYKFHCGEWVGAVTVGNELEVFRQLCQSPESHTHGEDTGTDTTVIRYLIADDGSGRSVHNKPDIGFDTTDFYISFIGSKYIPFFVRVLVNKGLNADSGSFAVVGNLLVGNVNVVQVFQGLGGFSQGEAEVDAEGQAQGHYAGIMFAEFQGGGTFRQCI